jgi:hypothetical protein
MKVRHRIWVAALVLLPGCFSARVATGPSVGLTPEAPDAVDVDAAIELMWGPRKLQRGLGSRHMAFDEHAPCHFGFGAGVSGRFGRQLATVGPTLSALGHCHASHTVSAAIRVESTVLELGREPSGFALGLLSPQVDLGPRLYFGTEYHEGVAIELTGNVGYQLRVGAPSYPTAGAMVRVSVGIVP